MTANVSILLATYQGERFLSEQLETLLVQTYQDWRLYVSDDGSTDRTLEIVSDFACVSSHGVKIMQGPGEGFLQNFMHLLASVPDTSEYFAFCDQDDRWVPDKLERAVNWLNAQPTDCALLYCTRTRSINESNNELGFSPLFMRAPSFSNALVQSIAGGNTMVINRKMLKLIRAIGTDYEVPSHDWWLYIIATGAGGHVKYDHEPSVDYRQHDRNQVGANLTFRARVKRLRMLASGRFKCWNDQHVAALERCEQILSPENKIVFRHFKAMRCSRFPQNLKHMYLGRFHRQTFAGNLGLLAGVVLRKI